MRINALKNSGSLKGSPCTLPLTVMTVPVQGIQSITKFQARPEAPGVYVDGAKVASLGLRIRQGRCYHGLSLNVDMDLEPFTRINPCGYPGLRVTRLCDLGLNLSVAAVAAELLLGLGRQFGYTSFRHLEGLPG